MKKSIIRTFASLCLCIIFWMACSFDAYSYGSVFGMSEEQAASDRILETYKNLAKRYRLGEDVDLSQGLADGTIPSFGETYMRDDGALTYYDSESHFMEICSWGIPDLGIARIDLNKDGTEELVIGNNRTVDGSSDGPTWLYAAYSVKGGIIRTIFQGWSRSFYSLAEDGSIIHYGSGGALYYETSKNDLIEDPDGKLFLKEKETVEVNGNEYPDEPYFYYPNGREIIGYNEYDEPEYSNDNAIQMDEEKGRLYYDRIVSEEIHIELERFDLQDD